jgi:hypothetical protein
MLNKKKMAGRVPLENVSERKKQNGRTRFGPEFSKSPDW